MVSYGVKYISTRYIEGLGNIDNTVIVLQRNPYPTIPHRQTKFIVIPSLTMLLYSSQKSD